MFRIVPQSIENYISNLIHNTYHKQTKEVNQMSKKRLLFGFVVIECIIALAALFSILAPHGFLYYFGI